MKDEQRQLWHFVLRCADVNELLIYKNRFWCGRMCVHNQSKFLTISSLRSKALWTVNLFTTQGSFRQSIKKSSFFPLNDTFAVDIHTKVSIKFSTTTKKRFHSDLWIINFIFFKAVSIFHMKTSFCAPESTMNSRFYSVEHWISSWKVCRLVIFISRLAAMAQQIFLCIRLFRVYTFSAPDICILFIHVKYTNVNIYCTKQLQQQNFCVLCKFINFANFTYTEPCCDTNLHFTQLISYIAVVREARFLMLFGKHMYTTHVWTRIL